MFTPNQIKELRLALCLSARDFAEKLGVDRDNVYLWESGRSHPRYHVLIKLNQLAKAAGVAVSA